MVDDDASELSSLRRVIRDRPQSAMNDLIRCRAVSAAEYRWSGPAHPARTNF